MREEKKKRSRNTKGEEKQGTSPGVRPLPNTSTLCDPETGAPGIPEQNVKVRKKLSLPPLHPLTGKAGYTTVS